MYAIIETGGKQIKAEAGHYIDIEKLPNKQGEKFSITNVLMLVSGKDSKIGTPILNSAKVNCELIEHGRAKKIIIYKMRPKKGTRKKQGHRQDYSLVYIESIELDGKKVAEVKEKPNSLKRRMKNGV